MKKIIQRSLLNALGTIAYISIVATIMQSGERIFGSINKTVGSIAFLTLFILSAAITGSLVLGKPVLMYLNGQKSEAVKLFLFTLCWLPIIVAILLIIIIQFK